MTSHSHLSVAIVTLTVLGIGTTRAQVQSQDAVLVRVEGAVSLNGQPIAASEAAILGDPAVIQTSEGRAVIALKRGGILTLDGHTGARIRPNGIDSNAIEILEGTAVVLSGTSAVPVTCRSEVRLSPNGVFRFDFVPGTGPDSATCRVRVYDGAASIQLVSVTSALGPGQTMTLDPRCGDMVQTRTFAREQLDDFDRWSRLPAAERHLTPRSTAGTKRGVAWRGLLAAQFGLRTTESDNRRCGSAVN